MSASEGLPSRSPRPSGEINFDLGVNQIPKFIASPGEDQRLSLFRGYMPRKLPTGFPARSSPAPDWDQRSDMSEMARKVAGSQRTLPPSHQSRVAPIEAERPSEGTAIDSPGPK